MKFNNEKLKNTSFVIDKEKKIEGRIASDIKPWLKFYDVDVEKYTDEKTAYLNTDMNVYDYFLAVTKQYGNALMIPYCSKNYHREDVITEVEKYIKRFNKMGINKGDIVSFMMLNNPDIIFMWLALSKIGAITNLIKFDEAEERIRDILNKTESKYFFISDVPLITEKVSKGIVGTNNLEKIICISLFESLSGFQKVSMLIDNIKDKDEKDSMYKEIKSTLDNMKKQQVESDSYKTDNRFISFSEWKKSTKDGKLINRPNPKGSEISTIVYTGGTTGNAKGVPLTNLNLTSSAYGFKLGEYDFDFGKSSMSILPPSIAYYFNATYCLMCCGVSTRLIPFFTPEGYPKLLNKYKPNIFLGGPILFNEMVDSGIIKDTSFITSPISGGDKLAVAEEERANNYIKEHGGTAVIHQGYGESECTAAATYAKTNAYALGSIGIPFINVLVSIFDEDYNEIINSYYNKKYNDSAYLIKASEIIKNKHILSESFHSPIYKRNIEKIKENKCLPLKDLVEFNYSKEKIEKDKNYNYIEIADINSYTNEIINCTEMLGEDLPSRASYKLSEDDLIVAVSGNSIGTKKQTKAMVTKNFENCICTNGFAVMN